MNKEELQKELGKKENLLELQLFEDKRMREEFAEAFDWGERNPYGSGEKEYKIPSWEQIFVKVGRLLSGENYADYSYRLENIEMSLNNLDRAIIKLRKEK